MKKLHFEFEAANRDLSSMQRERKLMLANGYMLASEVARRLGKSPSCIYRCQQFNTIRVGRYIYVEILSIAKYLGQHYLDLLANSADKETQEFLKMISAQQRLFSSSSGIK